MRKKKKILLLSALICSKWAKTSKSTNMDQKTEPFPGLLLLYFRLVSAPANTIYSTKCVLSGSSHSIPARWPSFPTSQESLCISSTLSLSNTLVQSSPSVNERCWGGWAGPYMGSIRRPPAGCAASSGWCPSGLCGPPEPSACLWTSHTLLWLHTHTHTHRDNESFICLTGRWAQWVSGRRSVCLTFVLAHFLDPWQRVDLHQWVGDADHVHHVHHTLHSPHTQKDTLTFKGAFSSIIHDIIQFLNCNWYYNLY